MGYSRKITLKSMVSNDERILWRGKPDKLCYVLEGIFNPLLPFALIWALFDFGMLFAATLSNPADLIFIGPFMLFHLMPVWLYIGGVFMISRKYANTEYMVTDKGVYVSGGLFSYTCEMKPFVDLSHINIHQGIIDQMLNVGDVVLVCSHNSYSGTYSNHSNSHSISICDIPDFQRVYSIIKELQTDIYSDTMYPNDMRPPENHGYRTRYTK